MAISKNFIRPFKACSAVCQHPDSAVKLLIDSSRSVVNPTITLVNACNSICVSCHSYID